MLEIFEYSFMIRAFLAGSAIAILAPMIGTFLVLKRYSLFSDSLAHVALAGIAIGLISGIYPIITALICCVIAAIIIENLRGSGRVYSESALSLFLYGSFSIALILISLVHGFNSNLFSYLFGSITTVSDADIFIILGLALVVMVALLSLYKELFYIAFDEESAKVSGLPVKWINMILMALAAVTVSLSMRIVGILMVGALMVIPVLAALQIAKSFHSTFLFAIIFSLLSVIVGLILSFYTPIVPGGTIVLLSIIIFVLSFIIGSLRKKY